ncbi:MAG: NAD-dependent epimerase/dehydratase family protein [Candidatus Omnitrophica bacterium]|nr:NAD-dependent epimerase/dehydratase family protein [Candidatus Omnitrophota bacterium]
MAAILITGGAGFLGSYVCERLLALGHSVVAFDMSNGEKIEHLLSNPSFRFVQDSILNAPALEREIDRSDIVVHFAAIADPKRYVMEPLVTLQIDLQGALNVFQMASKRKAKVIFASTSEVYGKNPRVPWKETDDRVLGSTHVNRWCYATAKAAGEHYCYAYHQSEGMTFVTYRFFNVYGPRLDDLGSGRVLPIFLKQCLQDEPITIHGDGSQTRTFVYVEDAADGVVRGMFEKQAENQVFNIGSSQELSILELAQKLKEVGKFSSSITTVTHQEVFGNSYEDIPRRVPDVSKSKKILKWEATTSIEDGLFKTIEYYRRRSQGQCAQV